jgi:Zn-dependent peptidase ImmA (M78 family)
MLEIEQGKRDISFERLRTLAYYFKRPLEVFYLDKVPDTKKVPDFRSGPATVELTRIALDHLRYIKDMKNTITELSEIVGIKPTLDYTNLFTIQDDPEAVGTRIRNYFKFNGKEYYALKDDSQAFKYWREKIEPKFIYMFQFGKVDPTIVRGFVYAEKPFPVIAVNQNDAMSARTFTLLHEFSHVVLESTGICDPFSPAAPGQNKIERFCQKIAAATLMEKDQLISDFKGITGAISIDTVTQLAKKHKASTSAMLIRLNELDLVNNSEYAKLETEYHDLITKTKLAKKKTQGGNFFSNYMMKMSPSYLRVVFSALDQGFIDYYKALQYLDVRLENLDKIRGRLERVGALDA